VGTTWSIPAAPAGEFAHDRGRGHDLSHRLALHAQADKEAADLRLGGLAGHELAHDSGHLRVRQVLAVGDRLNGCLDIHAGVAF
jgi:hypothetical protein